MGQDSQETPSAASTWAASVREISILMTWARSEGGKGGEVSCQSSPRLYISATDLTWPQPAGFKPVSSGLWYLMKGMKI